MTQDELVRLEGAIREVGETVRVHTRDVTKRMDSVIAANLETAERVHDLNLRTSLMGVDVNRLTVRVDELTASSVRWNAAVEAETRRVARAARIRAWLHRNLVQAALVFAAGGGTVGVISALVK